jgi:ArsR family transcriptional regulator
MMSMMKSKKSIDKKGLLDMELLEEAAPTLRTLAHPMRLRIIDFLKDGEQSVSDIVEATGKSQALTSHQLGLLRARGVIKSRREGSRVYYRIVNYAALGLLDCIRAHKV